MRFILVRPTWLTACNECPLHVCILAGNAATITVFTSLCAPRMCTADWSTARGRFKALLPDHDQQQFSDQMLTARNCSVSFSKNHGSVIAVVVAPDPHGAGLLSSSVQGCCLWQPAMTTLLQKIWLRQSHSYDIKYKQSTSMHALQSEANNALPDVILLYLARLTAS